MSQLNALRVLRDDSGEPLERVLLGEIEEAVCSPELSALSDKAFVRYIKNDIRRRGGSGALLLAQNVNPKVVSEMSGHATIAITLDTYSHMLPGMGGETATAMEDVLSQGASKVTPTRSSGVREAASPMHGRLAAGSSVTPGYYLGSVVARHTGS